MSGEVVGMTAAALVGITLGGVAGNVLNAFLTAKIRGFWPLQAARLAIGVPLLAGCVAVVLAWPGAS